MDCFPEKSVRKAYIPNWVRIKVTYSVANLVPYLTAVFLCDPRY